MAKLTINKPGDYEDVIKKLWPHVVLNKPTETATGRFIDAKDWNNILINVFNMPYIKK